MAMMTKPKNKLIEKGFFSYQILNFGSIKSHSKQKP